MGFYIVLAAMKGRFLSENGNPYDNFQMLGYVDADTPSDAVVRFFEEPHFPIQWRDVQYMWAEQLTGDAENGHYGDYHRVYIDDIRKRYEVPSSEPEL